MRSASWLSLALLTGCWNLEVPAEVDAVVPFVPDVGAPEGWRVDGFDMELRCPDGNPGRFYLVYPEDKAAAPDQQRELLPLAIVFHSGSFDFVGDPKANDPTSGRSYQQTLSEEKRITWEWAVNRVFATLGMYPNDDGVEYNTGALPAALAEKGIAMMLPINCWGDWWHNRSSVEQNNFESDFFLRDGRTAAEFAYLHATTAFPPGNPLELPIGIDANRVYLIGLGEGGRAVSELISLRETIGDTLGGFLYRPAAIVLDSPIDDLRPYYDNDSEAFQIIRSGLNRIFPAGRSFVMRGSLAFTQIGNVPARSALMMSTSISRIPSGANDAAIQRLRDRNSPDVWIYNSVTPQHVLSNADVNLSKSIADYLIDGIGAVDPQYISP